MGDRMRKSLPNTYERPIMKVDGRKVWIYQLIFDIMKLWLPQETYTQSEISMAPTTRIFSNLNATTASKTAPGAKSKPNFNMGVKHQLPCQSPMHWPTSFAIYYQGLLSRPLVTTCMQIPRITSTWKS